MEVEIDDEKENGEIEEVQTLHDNILVFRFQKQEIVPLLYVQ